MRREFIAIREGSVPILALSIHSCHAYSPADSGEAKEARATKSLTEALHSQLGYYSFIYTGYRTQCISDTREALCDIIMGMLAKYSRIGAMSIHGRNTSAKKEHAGSIFELGTLNGKTLDPAIEAELRKKLGSEDIAFDYNCDLTGGEEVQILHWRFNDEGYGNSRGTPGYNPKSNKLQMAQLEFDDWKNDEEWVKGGVDLRVRACKVFGDILMDYLRAAA